MMEGVKFSSQQLDSLKQFVKLIKSNPKILDQDHDLIFFKEFLINDCGATKLVISPDDTINETTRTTGLPLENTSCITTKNKNNISEQEEEGFLIKEVKSKSLIVEVVVDSSLDKTSSVPEQQYEDQVNIIEERDVMKELTNVREVESHQPNEPHLNLISDSSNLKKEETIIQPEKELILSTSDSKYLNIMNMSDSNVKEKNMKIANECIKKGNELYKKNEYQLAAIYYGKAIECSNGESAMTFIKRAECLAMMNKPLSVRRDCDVAIKLNPDAGKAFNLRGKALLALGKVDQAKKDLEMFKKLNCDISNMDKVDKLIDQINDIRSVKSENTTTTTTTKSSTTTLKEPVQSTTATNTTKNTNTTATPKPSQESKPPTSSKASSCSSGDVPNFVNPQVMKLVAGDEQLMRAFQNPRLVNAINEIAINPSAFLKYNNDIEVVTMFKKFTEIIGRANKH